MPTPSKFEEVLVLSEKEKYFQNNTFEESIKDDVLCDSATAIVLVDKDKLQTKAVQADELPEGKI